MTSQGKIDILNLFAIEKPSATDSRGIGRDIEQIKLAIAPYHPDIIIADIGDSGDKIAQLIKYYGEDMVFGCRYNSSPRSSGQINPTWSTTGNTVKADKLTQNKQFITMLKEGRINIFNDPDSRMVKLYIYHWQNVVIREEEDEKTGEFYQVITAKNDDHYAQSSIYAMLGLEHMQDLYKNGGGYEFNSGFVTDEVEPTRPDIFTQHESGLYL